VAGLSRPAPAASDAEGVEGVEGVLDQ